jgi:hypothetical protein
LLQVNGRGWGSDSKLRKSSALGLFGIVFGGSFALRLAIAAAFGYLLNMRNTEMLLIALNLTAGRGYADPFGFISGPTAHSTPPFPLFLAAILMIFGTGRLGQAVISTSACAASALRCALTPLFVEDAGLGRPIVLLSAVLSAIDIAAVRTDVSGGVDGPFVSLSLLAIVWMSLRLWRSAYWQTRTPLVFFAVCGFSVLLNPQVLPVIAGIFVVGFFLCGSSFRKRFFGLGVMLGVCILFFLLPWALRNWVELDAFIPLRSDFGMELWASNGPGRSPIMEFNEKLMPVGNRDEALKVVQMGEVDYNSEKMEQAVSWISANPAQFARLTLLHFVLWWFPPGAPAVVLIKATLTVLAFYGLWILWRTHRPVAILFAITWVTLPTVYYFIQWTSRFRYPMEWQLIVCASVSLHSLWQLRPRRLRS